MFKPNLRGLFTIVLTLDTEYNFAFINNGMRESFGVVENASVKTVQRESVKQLITTPLNSINYAKPNVEGPIHGATESALT